MQRFLSAVVILSIGALASARAAAQSPPAASATPGTAASAQSKAAGAPTAAGKPLAAKPNPAKPPAAEPAPNKKPDDRLSDEAELARVVGLYEAGKYRLCSSEMERLLDPLGKAPLRQPCIIENARVYWAACLLGGTNLAH